MSNSALDMLLAEKLVSVITLSDLKFFEPKPSFIQLMNERFAGFPIFDIGAGVGHVSAMLENEGFIVKALDLIPRENSEFLVELQNAVSYRYPADAVMLFCRPCHNDFVRATIAQGIRCGVHRFVYVSKPANINMDLSNYRRNFRLAGKDVGCEKESMYIWEF